MSNCLKRLAELLNSETLRNGVRLGILIALRVLNEATFTELVEALMMPKSTVHSHIRALEEEGFVEVKRVLTMAGPRTMVRITDKGRRIIDEYLRIVGRVERGEDC